MAWRRSMPCVLLLLLMMRLHTEGLDELHSSTQHLRAMAASQDDIADHLQAYIDDEVARLHNMQRALDAIRKRPPLPDTCASPASVEDMSHPVTAYHFIHKWGALTEQVHQETNKRALQTNLHKAGAALPTKADIRGASDAILRLQQIYNLSTEHVANGSILDHRVTAMTADEMVTIGVRAHQNHEHSLSISWLEAALASGGRSDTVTSWALDLSRSYFLLGDYQRALDLLEKEEEKDPDSYIVQKYLDWYTEYLQNNETLGRNQRDVKMPQWKLTYEDLCRGHEGDIPARTLFCRYRHSSIPYILFKEEVYSKDPWISLLYDVIGDEEIELIKEWATPQLTPAGVVRVGNPSTQQKSPERVGKVAWLWDFQHQGYISRFSQRVELITGLDTTHRKVLPSAEPLQVVNYGLGGQYEPHFDFFESDASLHRLPPHLQGSGHRMATFMFYLSDVVAGGATVFPDLNLRVPATKNAAIFWFNLYKSGYRDTRTRHAGCPVLLGEKWVANKWILEHNQHAHRPCGITEWESDC